MSSAGVPDFRVASLARMYDYFLGGKDNFAADREAAEEVISIYPETRILARANRRFLTRAIWYLADQGIRQYIDLGCGLPTSPNVHEVARQVRPDARVVYVDSDPIVASHIRAFCIQDKSVSFVERDIRYPREILADRVLTDLIDLSEPVAILCIAVLHFIPDKDNPKDIIAAFRWRMAPGSYLTVAHATSDDVDPCIVSRIEEVYRRAAAPAVPRTAADIGEFFSGLDLVEPGLVDVSQWRPDAISRTPTKIRVLAAMGRKSSMESSPGRMQPRPLEEDDAPVGGNAGVSERELTEWAESRRTDLRIAAALARQITEQGWRSWHPIPVNLELARVWECSPGTAGRAKRLLRERGVLVYENRAYYVA